VPESTEDGPWGEYWASNGTFTFEPDVRTDITRGLTNIYKGQNRLVEAIAKAVEEAWPSEYLQYYDGRRATPPAEIVRQFLIEHLEEVAKDGGDSTRDA
jgi:hypothetical protein